jgi:hypothetical protein
VAFPYSFLPHGDTTCQIAVQVILRLIATFLGLMGFLPAAIMLIMLHDPGPFFIIAFFSLILQALFLPVYGVTGGVVWFYLSMCILASFIAAMATEIMVFGSDKSPFHTLWFFVYVPMLILLVMITLRALSETAPSEEDARFSSRSF